MKPTRWKTKNRGKVSFDNHVIIIVILLVLANIAIRQAQPPKIVTSVTQLECQPDDFVVFMRHPNNDETIKICRTAATNRLSSVFCLLPSDSWHGYCYITSDTPQMC